MGAILFTTCPALYLLMTSRRPSGSSVRPVETLRKASGVGGFHEPVSEPVSGSPQEKIQQRPVSFVREDCAVPPPPHQSRPKSPVSQEDVCVLKHWEVCFGSPWSCGFPEQLKVKGSSSSAGGSPTPPGSALRAHIGAAFTRLWRPLTFKS